MSKAQRTVKVVLLGRGAVGKTCLCMRYIGRQFPDEYIPTVLDMYEGQRTLKNGESVNLLLIDTAQQDYDRERYLSYNLVGSMPASVVIMCFSVRDDYSVIDLKEKFVREMRYHLPTTPIVVVATKLDLRDKDTQYSIGRPKISAEQGYALAKRLGAIAYIETSSLEDQESVDAAFSLAIELGATLSLPQFKGKAFPVPIPLCLDHTEPLQSVPRISSTFHVAIGSLLDGTNAFSDIELVCKNSGEVVAKAHRAVLVCVSPLFRYLLLGIQPPRMFSLNVLEAFALADDGKSIRFDEAVVPAETLLVLVRCLYSLTMDDASRKALDSARADNSVLKETYVALFGPTLLEESLGLDKAEQTRVLRRMFSVNCSSLLLKQHLLSDVRIKVQDSSFECHKAILTTRCPFMAGLLSGGLAVGAEPEIDLAGEDAIPSSLFAKFLEFIYTDDIELGSKDPDLLQLLVLADRFCMNDTLGKHCEHLLAQRLQDSTAEQMSPQELLEILQVTKQANAKQLEQFCTILISKIYVKSRKDPAWHLADVDTLAPLQIPRWLLSAKQQFREFLASNRNEMLRLELANFLPMELMPHTGMLGKKETRGCVVS